MKWNISIFMAGLFCGAIIMHVLPDVTKKTEIYTTTSELKLTNGIIILPQTTLLKIGQGVGAGPYGEFVLGIDMDYAHINQMHHATKKGDWFFPYWVK